MQIISEFITDIENLDPRQYIIVKGAKVNNLKNINVAIPRNCLVVVTGLSGSGKSSLAFDTIFAEGQRMYVESLSAYARQFLGRMEKPDVEYIKGISPAIAVEQKGNSKNPRATVGTTTEIYDYIKLLFARVGKTYSPISGEVVKKDTVTEVVNYIQSFENDTRFLVLSPLIINEGRTLIDELKIIFQKGFTRIIIAQEIIFIEDFLTKLTEIDKRQEVFILIDRNVVNKTEEDNQFRIADSIQTAFYEGNGVCLVEILGKEKRTFSDKFERDGITFEEPSVAFFSFNNPYGACKRCGGIGNVTDISEALVIPNHNLSIYEGSIAPWETEKMMVWKKELIRNAHQVDLPIHKPYKELSQQQKDMVWHGTAYFAGIWHFFAEVQAQTHKIQYRVMLARYKGKISCPDCRGTRLRKDAGFVKINQKSIIDLALMPIDQLFNFFQTIELSAYEQSIAQRILIELISRLDYLNKVGLGYLTLNRLISTLSGGEYQRIKLSTALGSALVGSMYILDEPSIGLHPRDTTRLINVLKDLRDLGNTVIVVEHEEEMMQAADQIIDIGMGAGSHGGNVVFQGKILPQNGKATTKNVQTESHTINFLTGKAQITIPPKRRLWTEKITLKGVKENNLKNIDVDFPLGIFCVVTGVSGSGKSTLVKDVLFPALNNELTNQSGVKNAAFDTLEGNIKTLQGVEIIDQNPIGKSTRSNPATYTKVYDAIRSLLADQALSKQRGYGSGHFSFNSDKGRCEACQGEGVIHIEMQFLADVQLTCETCKGKRFKKEILDVMYEQKTIADILDLTIDDAINFFTKKPRIVEAIKPLAEVGLGYVRLGQPTSTLSGGEAQRLKLASYLDKKSANNTDNRLLFIFDEPTTGLHFADIDKLLNSFQALVEKGNSIIVIEHNLEVIKSADWVIDLGPDSGINGGEVIFQGTPEQLVQQKDNFTAQYLQTKFKIFNF